MYSKTIEQVLYAEHKLSDLDKLHLDKVNQDHKDAKLRLKLVHGIVTASGAGIGAAAGNNSYETRNWNAHWTHKIKPTEDLERTNKDNLMTGGGALVGGLGAHLLDRRFGALKHLKNRERQHKAYVEAYKNASPEKRKELRKLYSDDKKKTFI